MPHNSTQTGNKQKDFRANLHAWYAAHGRRDLPWRNTNDPYAIWVSEVMLQQTQVATVLARFYPPFMQQFPTIQSLASAPREAVLKAWQGLGYYSRAVNLHKAAQACPNGLPNEVESLKALPGIGKNTAHAITAFAFHTPVPVLEANVKRVIHRLFALETASDKALWQHAETLLDQKNPFDYNQAMMDLGAMLCTPRAPKCDECPAAGICQGKAEPLRYPTKKPKKKVPVRKRHILLRFDAAGRVFATPRTERFLGGMYRFIESETPPHDATHLGNITHTYSHFKLEAAVYLQIVNTPSNSTNWHSLEALTALPHSKTEEKALKLLER